MKILIKSISRILVFIFSTGCIQFQESPLDPNSQLSQWIGLWMLSRATSGLSTPNLSYLASTYTLTAHSPVSISANAVGAISNCTANPPLPLGLDISPTNCNITGTPTTVQGQIHYLITARSENHTATATISISIQFFQSWSSVQSILTVQSALGVSGLETTTTFGSLAGTSKWDGGVLAPNGRIYGIPRDSSSVFVIDPAIDTATTFGSLGTGGTKSIGGVLAPNGKIYGIPFGAPSVLVIDPATDTAISFGDLLVREVRNG